jgi:hypothetical protein
MHDWSASGGGRLGRMIELSSMILLGCTLGGLLCGEVAAEVRGLAVPVSHEGTTADHDYFDERGETKKLIISVETHHLYGCPHNSQRGFFTDVAEGKYHNAFADLDYLLGRVVNHPRALQLVGSLGILTKKPGIADRYFVRALALYPQYALTQAQYGSFLINSGQLDAGIGRLKKAVEMEPNLAIAHAWLSKGYQKQGSLELAAEAAEKARALGYSSDLTRQDEVSATALDRRVGEGN